LLPSCMSLCPLQGFCLKRSDAECVAGGVLMKPIADRVVNLCQSFEDSTSFISGFDPRSSAIPDLRRRFRSALTPCRL